MATSVSICSNALLMLGANPINSLDEDLDRARIASNLYPTVRDDMLRSHPWNCAIKRVILSPATDEPAFGYAYKFNLPGDWLRTLAVGEEYETIDFKHEGRTILSDASVLKLLYIFRNKDEASWDAMLVRGMELAMAARMAYAITQSAALEQVRAQELEMALKRARAVDGQDDPPQTFGDFGLIKARF